MTQSAGPDAMRSRRQPSHRAPERPAGTPVLRRPSTPEWRRTATPGAGALAAVAALVLTGIAAASGSAAPLSGALSSGELSSAAVPGPALLSAAVPSYNPSSGAPWSAAAPSPGPVPLTSAAPSSPARVAPVPASPRSAYIVRLAEQADVSGAHALASKAARGRYVYERLRAVAERTQGPLVDWLTRRGAAVQPFYIVNALAVEADAATIALASVRPDVAAVRRMGTIRLIEPVGSADAEALEAAPRPMSLLAPNVIELGLRTIGADKVWKLGYEGDGIVVAITDTGAAFKHPAIKEQYRGVDGDHDYNWFDAIASEAEPLDDHGHGTHVTGTAVGKSGTRQIGVAPAARWIACRLIKERSGPDAASLACLQWVLAPTRLDGKEPRPDLAPDVVNASWGGEQGKDCGGTAELAQATANLGAAGILFVAAAGNDGDKCGTVCAPGLYPEAWTVANYNDATNKIADSSSRGPVQVGDSGAIKPDITAPGTDINSSLPPTKYGDLTGTSMAAPHVAGAAALLLSAVPGLRGHPDAVRELFQSTAGEVRADKCGPQGNARPNNSGGYGLIDVKEAVSVALSATPTSTATPTATRTATPVRTATSPATPTQHRGPVATATDAGPPPPTAAPDALFAIFLPSAAAR